MKFAKSRSGAATLILSPAEAVKLGSYILIESGSDFLRLTKAGPETGSKVYKSGKLFRVAVPKAISSSWPPCGAQEVTVHEAPNGTLVIERPNFSLTPAVHKPREAKDGNGHWTEALRLSLESINKIVASHSDEVSLYMNQGRLRAKVKTTITL